MRGPWRRRGLADEMGGVPEIRPGVLKGYLPKEAIPDSASLLPPPPALGSAAEALDQEVARANLALRGTSRWKLASMDADLSFPSAAGDFSCALGAPVTEQDTPRLYVMLRRVMTDAGASTGAARTNTSTRARSCSTASRHAPRTRRRRCGRNGSYPSGHTAIGWAWALVLSEASPIRAKRSSRAAARSAKAASSATCIGRAT